MKELQSLALDMRVFNEDKMEIKLRESTEEELDMMDQREAERRSRLLESDDYVPVVDEQSVGTEEDIDPDAFSIDSFSIDDDLLALDDDAFAIDTDTDTDDEE